MTEGDTGRNKENSLNWENKSNTETVGKGKRKTYEEAVKELHSKIMKLKI